MRSPQTTGLEWPRPGTAVFQRMLRSGPAAGSAFQTPAILPSATPEASGPRNRGQCTVSAAATAPSASAASGSSVEVLASRASLIRVSSLRRRDDAVDPGTDSIVGRKLPVV